MYGGLKPPNQGFVAVLRSSLLEQAADVLTQHLVGFSKASSNTTRLHPPSFLHIE